VEEDTIQIEAVNLGELPISYHAPIYFCSMSRF